jgi:hypothetical protein
MRSPLNIDDFESFLEEEVNQHRMYPSDHVWRNIQGEVHGYKKWPALTVITLFVISALVAGTLLLKPSRQAVIASVAVNAPAQVAVAADKAAPVKENLQQHLSPEHITQRTIAAVVSTADIDEAIQHAFADYNGVQQLQPAAADNYLAASPGAFSPAVADANTNTTPAKTAKNNNTAAAAAAPVTALAQPAPGDHIIAQGGHLNTARAWQKNTLGFNWMKVSYFDTLAPNRFYYTGGKWKTLYGKIWYTSAVGLPSSRTSANTGTAAINTITTPKNSYSIKSQPKIKRFDVQVYTAPSVSYRTLSYEKGSKGQPYLSGIPYGAGYVVDISKLVRNKASSGYEAGAAVGYKLNRRLTVRAGLQFNVREYDIEAYKLSNTVTDAASAVADNLPVQGVDVSSQVVENTKLSQTVVITNRYYQISMPVGLDWKAWGYKRFSIGIAGSIQPTYIFDKDPFVVMSDYKSYVDGSKLMRKWNVNTNFETYFAYTSGKFKWQIGPQFRYQVLSTLNASYPVKEHLLDYGIKIGVVRSLP